MGAQSSDTCCYCYPYNEEGEYSYKCILGNFSYRNNNNRSGNNDRSNNNDRSSNNDSIINNDRLFNNFNFILNQILLGEEGAQNDNNIQLFNFSSQMIDNDVSQLDSRILENIDDLCPEKKRCTICLENFIKFDKVINLSCLHMFHDNCIKTWLKKNDYCPICKNKIDF